MMRRLPWWAVGLVAAVIAYAVMAAGLSMARSVVDPEYCGLPGLELLVVLGTAVLHPWLGFSVATALTRRGWRAQSWAFVVGLPVTFGAVATDLWGIGPAVFPRLFDCDDPFQWLPGLVVTGVSAALYALAGTSARKPSISSATRSGRSSGRK